MKNCTPQNRTVEAPPHTPAHRDTHTHPHITQSLKTDHANRCDTA